jgi:hypothetical protein
MHTPLKLTDAEREALARICRNNAGETVHEAIAGHFVVLGLERAAMRCDELAALTRKQLAPVEAVAKAFEIAAAAIRSDK